MTDQVRVGGPDRSEARWGEQRPQPAGRTGADTRHQGPSRVDPRPFYSTANAEGEFRTSPGRCTRIGVSVARCSGDMDCRHQGFYSVGSSYDRETKVLTFFSYCDECGTRLAEVARLTYEPRFVATAPNARLRIG